MSSFLRDAHEYAMTNREVHDELRGLLKLASESDPAFGQIRARIRVLPRTSCKTIYNGHWNLSRSTSVD